MTDEEVGLLSAFKFGFIKAKDVFSIESVSKKEAYDFVRKHHYLGDTKFFSAYSYGLFIESSKTLVGIATYCNPQGIVSLKGWFSLSNSEHSVMELYRLCMIPELNGCNATSFLLGGSMRKLKKEHRIRAVITLADSNRHVGSIYQVCNFKYYGLTDKKSDFFAADGSVNRRGAVKDVKGVWLPRTRKHRYAYIMDSSLVCNYAEQKKPNMNDTEVAECCHGFEAVYDRRFGVCYTCPKCTGELRELEVTNG